MAYGWLNIPERSGKELKSKKILGTKQTFIKEKL